MDGSGAHLSRSVPDLQFDVFAVDLNHTRSKLDTDRVRLVLDNFNKQIKSIEIDGD